MLDTVKVRLAIANRLKILMASLKSKGVILSFLPNEAKNYAEEKQGSIRIVLSSQTGKTPSLVNIPVQNIGDYDDTYSIPVTQEVEVELFIRLSLPRMHTDEQSVEVIARKIVMALSGYSPLPVADIRAPLHFNNYELMQPEGDRWIAHISMKFIGLLRVTPEPDETIVLGVQLSATNDLDLLQNNTLLFTIGDAGSLASG